MREAGALAAFVLSRVIVSHTPTRAVLPEVILHRR
jgi:hypothetical protein